MKIRMIKEVRSDLPLTKCFVCNFSWIECKNFEMYKPNSQNLQTNADRVRSMTDEELAMWINDVTTNALSVLALGSNKQTKTIFYWLDWLKQEAKE